MEQKPLENLKNNGSFVKWFPLTCSGSANLRLNFGLLQPFPTISKSSNVTILWFISTECLNKWDFESLPVLYSSHLVRRISFLI